MPSRPILIACVLGGMAAFVSPYVIPADVSLPIRLVLGVCVAAGTLLAGYGVDRLLDRGG